MCLAKYSYDLVYLVIHLLLFSLKNFNSFSKKKNLDNLNSSI